MKVVEKFISINGEGARAGELAAFIRFKGCNMVCSYCDTAWANSPDCPYEEMTPEEIADYVRAAGVVNVTLTGGEPLLQEEMRELLEGLSTLRQAQGTPVQGDKAWCNQSATRQPAAEFVQSPLRQAQGTPVQGDKAWCTRSTARQPAAEFVQGALRQAQGTQQQNTIPLRIEIETNGSVDISPFCKQHRPVFTLDYKLPSSGCEEKMLTGNFRHLQREDSVKFVCGSDADLYRAKEIISEYDLVGKCNIYLSPVFGSIEPARMVDFMIENSLNGVRLQLQMHKVIWAPDMKGV